MKIKTHCFKSAWKNDNSQNKLQIQSTSIIYYIKYMQHHKRGF